MTKTKLLVIILVIFIFAFRIWQTTGCQQFSAFFFNPLSVKISVESQVLSDSGVARNISRFFHNKVTVGIFELTKSLASTFDTRFLLEILGPIGLVLIILTFAKIIKERNVFNVGLFGLILAASFVNIIFNKPKLLFYVLAMAWYIFALRSVNFFWKGIRSLVILIVLIFATFWYFIFSWQMPTICREIFFR